MSRSAALEKLAKGLRLVAEAEAELRAAEEPPPGDRAAKTPVRITDLDRARARKALQRRGLTA